MDRNDPFRKIIGGHTPMNISNILVITTTTKFLPHCQGYWEASKQRGDLRFGDSGELHMHAAPENYRLDQKEDE